MYRLFALGAAVLLTAGCSRQPASDTQARDLQLAPLGSPDQSVYATPQELAARQQALPVAYAQPERVVYRTSRPAPQRTATVYRARRKVTHSRRDAVIGAAAGAVTGAVIGRNVKGAIIGAGVGGVLGAVVGATVDVEHR